MTLRLFPARAAIGVAVDKDGRSYSVFSTPEFNRALAALLVRVGGEEAASNTDIETLLSFVSPPSAEADKAIHDLRVESMVDHTAEIAELRKTVEELKTQLSIAANQSAAVAELGKSLDELKAQIACSPDQTAVVAEIKKAVEETGLSVFPGNTVELEKAVDDLALRVELVPDSSAQLAETRKSLTSMLDNQIAPLMSYGGYHFDGSANYLDGNALTGIADGKKGTWVGIVRFANSASATEYLHEATSQRFYVGRLSTGAIQIRGLNSALTQILMINSSVGACSAAGTYIIMASWDLATAGSGRIWINNVSSYGTETTYTDDTIDYTTTEHGIGARATGASLFSGDIYTIWFDATTNLEFNTESVRRKFISASNVPVFLGTHGQLPTGSRPILFLGYDSYTTWPKNRGSAASAFVENGTPAAVTTAMYGQYFPFIGPATSAVLNKSGAALATTATDGFTYIPTCAGAPTGTPTTVTGCAPVVIDSTNNKLYFYSGGAWRDAGP